MEWYALNLKIGIKMPFGDRQDDRRGVCFLSWCRIFLEKAVYFDIFAGINGK